MKYLSVLFLLIVSSAIAEDYRFTGAWQTNRSRTKQALDGPITCDFKSLGNEKYSAKFYGIWQGVPYEYDVKFTGKPDTNPRELTGTAMVDGVPYTWTGTADKAQFNGSFTSHNYVGSFSLRNRSYKSPK